MIIRDMFAKDINRKINGVVQVEQDEESVIYQEVDEYVVTKELKRLFMSFFNSYNESFQEPTADVGVWISGFFGSGKSHFLKMLAYLLENKSVNGIRTVDLFKNKFEGDSASFMAIENSSGHETETILFNIDVEGLANKDNTAVLRVFAKMFYKHLGYYGENPKVVMLEKYIESQGKTEEFRRVFELKSGKSWLVQRKGFAFNGKVIIPTLMEVLDMSEEDANHWFSDKSDIDFSVSDLVADIKDYIDKKPEDFRLLFMVDEVGQYIGTNTDMILNLQSLVEEMGRVCRGKVWVFCTGQEAIDEIIQVRIEEFSRIFARFKIRLSLSSSSVDEVIQERILKKTSEAEQTLQKIYDSNEATLRNFFVFKDSRSDMKGYCDSIEFSNDFPFVSYQFTILQKAFEEIRKKGYVGKEQSGVERSMLSAFQETAKNIQERDEYTLAPFFMFYDTVHASLDGSIRRVIERCERAASSNAGIETRDVDILKLLYLIRYVDDIPANLDNIAIMMADNICVDKINLREDVRSSLGRLHDQNYIGRTGDVYNFLTDEEQDVAREIKNTQVDTSTIVGRIGNMIFSDIYTAKKFRYGIYDFPYDQMVDGMSIGSTTGGMLLRFLTVATDPTEKTELRLMTESKGTAIAVLPDSAYYESLENAMKIRKYVKQRNVQQLPKSMQDIIRNRQDEASVYETTSLESLRKGIEDATFYVDGERLEIPNGDAKTKIDQALEYLVEHVYSELNLIGENAQSDEDIYAILRGENPTISDMDPNRDAAAKMEEYLEMQFQNNMPTSMADIQSRYQSKPYGWREIDIAAVAARLIAYQKVTIKYAGTTIRPDDSKLPDMLRKKSETGKTSISVRVSLSAGKLRETREFLREYFDVMDVPGDEDGLIASVIEKFTCQQEEMEDLDRCYEGHNYPDREIVQQGINLTKDVLSQQKDNMALIDRLLEQKEDLEENKEQMQRVAGFFKNQVQVFDAAVQMEDDLKNDLDYLPSEPEAKQALDQIRVICAIHTGGKVDYKRIPELNGLMNTVRAGHDQLLADKRSELLENVRQCMEAIHTADDGTAEVKTIIQSADNFYTQKKEQVAEYTSLALLDSLLPQMIQYQNNAVNQIEALKKPDSKPQPNENAEGEKKVYKNINRSILFPAKRLESEEDIEEYVETMKQKLEQYMQKYDGIDLK